MSDDPEFDDGSQTPDLGGLINGIGVYLQNGLNVGGYMDWGINNVAKAAQVLKGIGLKSASAVLAASGAAIKAIIEGEEQVAAPLASWTLGLIFGNDAGAIFSEATSRGGVHEGAEAVGAAVLAAVFGPLSIDGGGELVPGVERAEGYLGAITNMVMRGFLIDVASEFVPELGLHFVADLEKELISGLGLGRVARTVLRPIVGTLVATPAQWAVNIAYRPKLLSEGDAIRAWHRGDLDDGALDEELGRQGWSHDRIESLKTSHLKLLDFGGLATLFDHGVMAEGDVVDALVFDGWSENAAQGKVQAHKLDRTQKLVQREWDFWIHAYGDGLVDRAVALTNLRNLGVPDDLIDVMMAAADDRRLSTRKLLSVGELFECWTNNVITQGQVHDYLIRLGYAEDDATTLLLNKLAKGQHADEVAQQRQAAKDARAAALAQAKADRIAAQKQARLDAAAARLEKEQAIAAGKATAAADAEARRQFVVDSAAARRRLVDAQQQAGTIAHDQAAALSAEISANEAALLAAATAQEANANVSFDQQILELRTAAQMADFDTQLADVDLSLEEETHAREAAVVVRMATVDQLLALSLADVDDLFTQRAANAADDLAASLAAVDVAVLPTPAERSSNAAQQIQALGDALTRKLADIADHYAELHQTVDEELAAKTLSDKAAANGHQRLVNAQAQAERLANQQHDLSVQRLTDVALAADTLDVTKADKAKLTIQDAAAKAARALATDKLKAENSARHAADAEQLRLQAIGAQTAPVTAAAAARKRASINAAIAKAQALQTAQAATIQKAAADAAAKISRAQTAVEAARERLQLVTSTSAEREAAAASAAAALEGFDAQTAAARDALEATILAHRVGPSPA